VSNKYLIRTKARPEVAIANKGIKIGVLASVF
jgi:hypothetical protein